MRVQWKTCIPSSGNCYRMTDPTVSGRRSLDTHTVAAHKPDADTRVSHYLPDGTLRTAIPASVKYDNNPDWAAYKDMNSKMRTAVATTAARRGQQHVQARNKSINTAGLRAIGGARHMGRSSSIKIGATHLRMHGIEEYGYTVGDFATPYHVSAIGDIHLICCDRFERAVRDTCTGVSETALSTWIHAGSSSWCHDTSCFDGQGLRGANEGPTLSWLDYTDYRWGNKSFTTRSECLEPRDWPDLMSHFRSMEACNGGLGKLLVPNRFHVWACFHNHPCATRALTDPIGLWILFEQGYRDFSIEQINILITHISLQITNAQEGGSWDGSSVDAGTIQWGIYTWAQIQSFFVFIVQVTIEYSATIDVFGSEGFGDLSTIFGELWWVGLASGSTGTCESIDRQRRTSQKSASH